jgi:hypothetical protein
MTVTVRHLVERVGGNAQTGSILYHAPFSCLFRGTFEATSPD